MADLDAIATDLIHAHELGYSSVSISLPTADALVAVARWAQEADHLDLCPAQTNWADLCTCGRDEALAQLEADT